MPSTDVRTVDIAILGGGISGLGTAWRASELGFSNLVIEKSSKTGGLWGSEKKKGFIFDHGVHGLYPASKETEEIITRVKNLVHDGFVESQKKTKILFKEKMLNYPLVPSEFFTKYGIQGFMWAVTLVWARVKCLFTGVAWMKNFKDYIVGNFGRTLYRIYFEPYVAKVWGIDPKNLCLDAVARRVKRIQIHKFVGQLIQNFFRIKGKKNYDGLQPFTFIYPKHGAGQIVDGIRDEASRLGGEFLLESTVVKINRENESYLITVQRKDGTEILVKAKHIVSTLPLPNFLEMLNPNPDEPMRRIITSLRYRALRIINILIDQKNIFDAQWIYFQGSNFSFSRLNEFKNLSPFFCPEGKTSLSIEFNCNEGDKTWTAADKELLDKALTELEQVEEVGSHVKEHLIDYFSVRLTHAYPLMRVETQDLLDQAKKYVKAQSNLYTIGRQGNFCYVNGDECIKMAFDTVNLIKEKSMNERTYSTV